ncbi:MAG: GNAT family N-acetyltransferase [Desulfobulbaceae bacterium]|nr:GNAT family N-acetyltransferase [Desulfobulbaceae bacterium]
MLQGKLVELDAVEKEDLPILKEWRNNPEFRKHFREYRELNSDMQLKWYDAKVVNDHTTEMFAIRDSDSQELLGCAGLAYINWIHRHADLSLYIGWQNSYIDDHGYAEDSCRLLLDYAFREIGLNKVWTEIYEFDHKKKALYDKLGFQQDGMLRQNYFCEGRWWDSRILSILAEEYKVAP